MGESEFKIGGVDYRTTKMNVFIQFHLARKIAPLMIPVAEALGAQMDFASLKDTKPDEMIKFAGPIIDALGRMSDAEADDIIFPCLAVVQRHDAGGWRPLLATGSRAMMFDDVTVQIMLQLVWKVLEANLNGFFQDVPSSSTEAPGSAPTT